MGSNLSMRIPAALSIAGCLLVLGTVYRFKRLRAMRYVEFVSYVAVNDLLAAIGVCLGNQPSGSFGCWIQGLGTSINFLSSMFWSTSIAVQVYLIVHRGKGIENMARIHAVCWLLPIFLTLIPLATNTYGNSDDDFWCFVSDRPDSPKWSVVFWDIAAFFFWLWLCICTILVLYVAVYIRIKSISGFSTLFITKSVNMLILYPLILIVCWLPPSIVIVQESLMHQSPSYPTELRQAALAAPTMQGCLLSVIFFSVNRFARLEWWAYFTADTSLAESLISEEYGNQPSSSSGRTSEIIQIKSYHRQASNTSGLSGVSGLSGQSTASTMKSSVFTMSDGDLWNSDDSANSTTFGRSELAAGSASAGTTSLSRVTASSAAIIIDDI